MSRPTALDRRTFLGGMGAAAGVAVATTAVPLSARAMSPLAREGAPTDRLAATAAESQAGGHVWDVDDMWGHAPRYAHPIPYSPARTSPIEWSSVDPIDRQFMI